MFQDDLKNHIDEVKNEFEDYVDKRISLLKLHLVEELSRFTAGFAVKLGILYLLFFVFMFLSLAAAFFLGDLLGSNGLRSEERRVGKECRSGCARYHLKKKMDKYKNSV